MIAVDPVCVNLSIICYFVINLPVAKAAGHQWQNPDENHIGSAVSGERHVNVKPINGATDLYFSHCKSEYF